MRLPRLHFLALCLLVSSALNAQTIVDTFPGNTLNSSNWTASNFPGGSVTVNDGVTLTHRGRITSAIGFTGPLTITGTVSFPDANEYLTIEFRFSGAYDDPGFGSASDGIGMLLGPAIGGVRFHIGSNTGGDDPLSAGFSFTTNTFYNFKITDDGFNVALFVDNLVTPILTTTSAISSGNLVGIYSRENVGTSVLSAVSISAVPEPATWGALAGVGALAFAIIRRKQTTKTG